MKPFFMKHYTGISLIYILLFLSTLSLSAMEEDIQVKFKDLNLLEEKQNNEDEDYILKQIIKKRNFDPIKENLIPMLIPYEFFEQLKEKVFATGSKEIDVPYILEGNCWSPNLEFKVHHTHHGGNIEFKIFHQFQTLVSIDDDDGDFVQEYRWDKDNNCIIYTVYKIIIFDLMQGKILLNIGYIPRVSSPNQIHFSGQYVLLKNNIGYSLHKISFNEKELFINDESLYIFDNQDIKNYYWSPNGKFILIRNDTKNIIFDIEKQTSISIDMISSNIAWSADSQYLVVIGTEEGKRNIQLINLIKKETKIISEEWGSGEIKLLFVNQKHIGYKIDRTFKVINHTNNKLIYDVSIPGDIIVHFEGFSLIFSSKKRQHWWRCDLDAILRAYKLLSDNPPVHQILFLQLISHIKKENQKEKITISENSYFPLRAAYERLNNNPILKKILEDYIETESTQSICTIV